MISQADKQCDGYALMDDEGDHAMAVKVVGVQGIECDVVGYMRLRCGDEHHRC